jgi:hypothetical protein
MKCGNTPGITAPFDSKTTLSHKGGLLYCRICYILIKHFPENTYNVMYGMIAYFPYILGIFIIAEISLIYAMNKS